MLANISYKVSAFVDFTNLEAEPKTVIDILQEFSDYNMMPAVADAFEFGNMPVPKLAFAMERNQKKIMIFNDRIDLLSVASTESGFTAEEIEQMTAQAADIMGRLFQKYERKSYRLAIYKEYMLFKLTKEESSTFAKEKFGYIPYYRDSDIVECSSRVVARENIEVQAGKQELCNMITVINRVNFERMEGLQAVMMDGFKLDFDLNTFQGNAVPRFEKEDIISFCQKMNEKSELLVKQMIGG